MTVRTEHREVRTETTEGQYSPVRLEQARLVSSLLYGTRLKLDFFFQTHFRSVKFKGLRARDDAGNSKRSNKLPRLTTLRKNLLTSSERFTSVSYGFHFWIGRQSVGITFIIQFFQVQLDWSRRNLSLSIEHLFWIRFRQSAKWLSFHLRFLLQC